MKLRLALFAIVFVVLVPISVLARPSRPNGAASAPGAPLVVGLSVVPAVEQIRQGPAGSSASALYSVENVSSFEDLNVTVTTSNSLAGWTSTVVPSAFFLPASDIRNPVTVNIAIPAGATIGQVNITTVTFTGVDPVSGATTTVTVTIRTTVTAVPTNTPTSTPFGATSTPTGTVAPVCAGGAGTRNDGFEYDGELARARRIEIDRPQEHALCPTGDEDWLFFGGLEGKVYTIDISAAVDGLDPSLTLYDADGNQLAFNDDFYLRGGSADPTDVKPRIQSWRALYNGQYYIKVRDAAGRGFNNALYTIVLISESYGPTPTLVKEICEDIYEQDGLPEQAPLMVVGEIHDEHKLCPRGDADWVKFFAKAGKSYSIFTSDLTVGADTVLVLADRDGTSIIDFNDDFGTGLSSRVDFSPPVDGFYYAQIKNVGDVGNQYISYQLTFQILENANGGGGGGTTPPPGTATETPDPGFPTDTPDSGIPTNTPSGATPTYPSPGPGTPTRTPNPLTPTVSNTPTRTPAPGRPAKLPPINNTKSGTFVDPAFENVWRRADEPVAVRAATRTWLWGPKSGRARAELYDQSLGGMRQVQYFDKSRMEITDFAANRTTTWYVTNGLLAKEMIQGRIQIGDSSHIQGKPAQIALAGDLDDSRGPTYASLLGGLPAVPDRTNQFAAATLDRAGKVGVYGGPQRDGAKLVHFVPQTGHNIAAAFWDFMNRRGPVKENGQVTDGLIMDWVFALGYPISEPYWTRVRVGGVDQDILVQAFERRVLTYTPNNPSAWQVEMGNVGQHYYLWRYGELPR